VIAVEDDELIDVRQRGERTFHCIAGAARWVLDDRDNAVWRIKPAGKIGGLRRDDEDADVWPRAIPGPQYARNHWDTGYGMQRFRDQ
jgi:hypothetical protein